MLRKDSRTLSGLLRTQNRYGLYIRSFLGARQAQAEAVGRLEPNAEREMTRTKRLQLYLVLAGMVIGLVSLTISTEALRADWLIVDEPLHAVVETTGALAAIVMAIFLLLKKQDGYGGKFFLLAMGFLGMGLIDVFHSISPAGDEFVLLRSVASFVGAVWFVSTWLPWFASERGVVWRTWTPWAVVVGSILFGIWTWAAKEGLPIMVKDGTFTSTAVTFNFLSGVFFLAAAIRLLIDFGRMGRPDIYLFACMATLFGLANLTFPGSELWDIKWWFWHLLRLLSYLLAVGFVIHEHQQAISDLRIALAERKKAEAGLRRYHDHLEELVQERTAELRKANEALQWQITERKCVEEALRKSEEQLEAVVDTSNSVICLKDTQGRYILVNREYETLFHVSRDDIKGVTDHDIFPKEMADTFRSNDLKVLEAKTSLEFEEVVPKNNQIHTYLSNKFPLADSNGIPYAICGISTDITERKRAEEHEISERKKAEGWLYSLIATTQDAVISIDRQNRVVLFNPAAERIFGYRQAEVQGRKVNLLMAGPYAFEHDKYVARFERTRDSRAIGGLRIVEGRRKNGEVFSVEISITQIRNDEEIRYAAFIRDISEKKRLQDQLVESERLAAIGATAAKLAHEIGNPLNGMSMAAQVLARHLAKNGCFSDERVNSTLQVINTEIKRLSALLYEFRSLYRREKYNFRPTALGSVIKGVLGLESPYYIANGIEVEMICPGDLPLIMADDEKLKQALLNLCKNAAEAMPDGGKITVRAYSSGQRIIAEVADTGVGIPDGIDILEPFTTTKASGSGLGLMIVRQIISAHGGTVTFTSDRGKGTIFTLTLPLTISV
jgi:PAS domain S-box-containing protein